MQHAADAYDVERCRLELQRLRVHHDEGCLLGKAGLRGLLLRQPDRLRGDVDARDVSGEPRDLQRVEAAAASEIEHALASRVGVHPPKVEVLARANDGVKLLVRRVVGVALGVFLVEAAELVVELRFL